MLSDTRKSRENESSSLIALSKHWCITREKGRKNNKVFLNKLNLSGQKCRAAHKTEDFPLKHSNLLKQEKKRKKKKTERMSLENKVRLLDDFNLLKIQRT